MLATKAGPSQLHVTQRVFLEPQQQVRLGLQHVTFSIDWVHVAGCAAEPLQAGLLRKMGMANKRPKRLLMVVMFKAEHNQITQMWADLDKEGLGGKLSLCKIPALCFAQIALQHIQPALDQAKGGLKPG